jgi:cytochrome b
VKRIRVWDLPTRLFHWLLALAVVAAFVSAKVGDLDVHALIGQGVLALLVFRIAWGFLGSTNARFAHFVRGPSAILAYLRGEWRGQGHNPLGALSVLAFLCVLTLQAVSGLFANDDSTFFGPLYALVSRETSDLFARIHHLQEPVIFALVLLHVAAIVFYVRFRKQDLLRPMITGLRDTDDAAGNAQDASGGGWLALLFCVVLAAGAAFVASGVWIPPPPPPPVEDLPPAW